MLYELRCRRARSEVSSTTGLLVARASPPRRCATPRRAAPLTDEDGALLVQGRSATGSPTPRRRSSGLTDVVSFLVEDELEDLGGNDSKSTDWASHVVQHDLLITGLTRIRRSWGRHWATCTPRVDPPARTRRLPCPRHHPARRPGQRPRSSPRSSPACEPFQTTSRRLTHDDGREHPWRCILRSRARGDDTWTVSTDWTSHDRGGDVLPLLLLSGVHTLAVLLWTVLDNPPTTSQPY